MATNDLFSTGVTPLASLYEAEQHTSNESYDFTKLFEEENYANSSSQHVAIGQELDDVLAPRPIAPSLAAPPGAALGQLHQGQPAQDNPLVNVLFIVDPTTQQVVFPKQQQQPIPQQQAQQHNMHSQASGLTSVFPNGLARSASPSVQGTFSSLPHPGFFNNVLNNGALNSNSTVGVNDNPIASVAVANALQQVLQLQQMQQNWNNKLQLQDQQNIVPALAPTANPFFHQLQQPQQQQQQQQIEKPATPTQEAPLRALSAYNFFFRDERDRILNDTEYDWSDGKQDKLLREHWNRDRTKKRRHRKTHGKIDFTSLSKLISSRWKALPDHRKNFYRKVAARDWDRYQEDLAKLKGISSAPASNNLGFVQVTG